MPFYDCLNTVADFQRILNENANLIILRFTATWCGPCKRLEPTIQKWIQTIPMEVDFYHLDIDVNEVVYSFLKKNRRLNGIPAILCYSRGNHSWIPDEFIVGGTSTDVDRFFGKCIVLYERNRIQERQEERQEER
jgi:thiol-disulfide isomerase/thioredoxin